MLMVSSTEVQNNFGRYLEMSAKEEIVITRKGTPCARLLGSGIATSFLADTLVGLVPRDVDEGAQREERLARQ